MRQRYPFSTLSFNIILEFLTRAIRQEEEMKEMQIGNKIKLSLFADDMLLYPKEPKNSTKKLLRIINTFSKVAGHKINIQKSVAFLCNNNDQTEIEFSKTIPFTVALKIPRYKFNKGSKRPLQ
jgi:hypothetical protein